MQREPDNQFGKEEEERNAKMATFAEDFSRAAAVNFSSDAIKSLQKKEELVMYLIYAIRHNDLSLVDKLFPRLYNKNSANGKDMDQDYKNLLKVWLKVPDILYIKKLFDQDRYLDYGIPNSYTKFMQTVKPHAQPPRPEKPSPVSTAHAAHFKAVVKESRKPEPDDDQKSITFKNKSNK